MRRITNYLLLFLLVLPAISWCGQISKLLTNPLVPTPDFLYPALQKAQYNTHSVKLPTPTRTNNTTLSLTLQDAVLLAIRNNPDVRSAELKRVIDKFDLLIEYNAFQPQYSLSGNVTYGPGIAPTPNLTPQVTLKTPLGTTFTANVSDTWGGYNSATSTFSVSQPLMQGLGADINLISLLNQEDQEKLNRLSLKGTLISTVTNVINDYYALVEAYKSLDIQTAQIKDAQAELNSTMLKIKVGQTPPSEAYSQQASLSQQQLSLITQQDSLQQSYQTLLQDLGLDPQAKVKVDTSLPTPTYEIPDVDKSVELALANSQTYQNDLVTIKADKRAILAAKDALRPALNLTATETQQISGGLNQSGPLLPGSSNANTRSVGLSLTMPIDSQSARQTLVQAQIQLEQDRMTLANDKRTIINTIINDIRNLKSQQQQIQLAKDNVKYSEQTYNDDKLKLSFGKITSFQLTSDQQNLIQAQQSLLNEQITYINDYATYEQDVGTTLEKWHITIKY